MAKHEYDKAQNNLVERLNNVKVPPGFKISIKGIYCQQENNKGKLEYIQIAYTPLWLEAYEMDGQEKGWRTVIYWMNLKGTLQSDAFDSSILTSPPIISELVKCGCKFVYGCEKVILQYINQFQITKSYRRIEAMGWAHMPERENVFVLSNEIISHNEHEAICYRPEQDNMMEKILKAKGSFEVWMDMVVLLKGNPLLIFCLSAAFAGPLLKLLNVENGFFHFFGRSSHGKTTALCVAGSVWGRISNSGGAMFIKTWAATSNALEGIAAAYNDILLILDELGQCDVFDFQKVAYDLASGQGKSRMKKDLNLATNKTWRIAGLSSGELSACEKMESKNKKSKAGQRLRIMDVPIDSGIIRDPHSMKPAEFSDYLKNTCSENYGWAGPAFVRSIIDREDSTEVIEEIIEMYNDFKKDFLKPGLEPEQVRAMNRFALVATAGSLAVDLEIIPLSREEVRDAVYTVRDIWLNTTTSLRDALRAVSDIRDYIDQNGIRFEAIFDYDDNYDHPRVNQAGYMGKHNGETLYLFNDVAFREACKGVNPLLVCAELKGLNFLHMNNPGKNKARFTMKDNSRRYFYTVRGAILAYES